MNNSKAYERIYKILDENSFIETMSFFATQVVTGYGQINGRLTYIFSEDKTIEDTVSAEKIKRLIESAGKVGAPIISIYDSKGADISENFNAIDSYASIITESSKVKNKVPQISIIAGDCVGISSILPKLSDFTFFIDGNFSSMYPLNVLSSAAGQNVDKKKVIDYSSTDFICKNEDDCFSNVKKLLSYLPCNHKDFFEMIDSDDDINRKLPDFKNVSELVKNLSDSSDFIELKNDYAKNLKTYLCHIGGMAIAVVANDKSVNEGRLDNQALLKATSFIKAMDAYNIPVLTLVDTKGFSTSANEENTGLSRLASELSSAYASASIPKVTLIVSEAVGSAYMCMCSKSLGADMVYALEDANVSLFTKEASEKLNDKSFDIKLASKSGFIDSIIKKEDIRKILVSTFDSLLTKGYDKE